MNKSDAKTWLIENLGVSRETVKALETYVVLLSEEMSRQNLISAPTLSTIWSRHIVDSAQLALLAPNARTWLDIGSGAGLPGLVLALITGKPITLVEPRQLRVAFLRRVANALDLTNVDVVATSVARLVDRQFDVITARAVAALPVLITMGNCLAHSETRWLFPKGKNAQAELATLSQTWQKQWAAHPSVTDPDSFILVGRGRFDRG